MAFQRVGQGGEEDGEGGSKNMLASHANCLEEIGHHVEAHGMWHMLLLNNCGIGQIEQIN